MILEINLEPEKIIWIKWVDSNHSYGWTDKKDSTPLSWEKMMCETVGYLLKETDYSYQVVQSLGGEQVDAIMEIPKCCIQEIRKAPNLDQWKKKKQK